MNTLDDTGSSQSRHATNIVATGCALLVLQIAIRSYFYRVGLTFVDQPISYLPKLLLSSFYDVIYSAGLTLLFLLLHRIFGKGPASRRSIHVSFVLIALLSVIGALMNLQFMKLVGAPFSYGWLYYSDFLMSVDSHEAVRANLSGVSAAYGLSILVSIVGLSALFRKPIQFLRGSIMSSRMRQLGVVGFSGLYLIAGAWYVRPRDIPLGTYENSVLYFLKSCLVARGTPPIFTMKSTVGNDDFLPVSARPPEQSQAPHHPEIKNVVLFVLESVGSQYVEAFGGKYPVTPTISRYRDKAALFQNIYVPAPMTVNALWSLECSMYPWISHKLMVREFPKVRAPSISGELGRHGYRTAFFNSGDNRYQRAEVFLSERDIQWIKDCRTIGSGQPQFRGFSKEHSDEGCDDRLTVAALTEWIDSKPDQPFFGMLWTVMTHYPYFNLGKEIEYVTGKPEFNRYLNALRIGDEALGKLLTHLEERGLMESTLVIVVGDHGEAFGQHDNAIHDDIYDETVHVPLIIINPRLFHGEVYGQIGASVDIAPTILDILRYSPPGPWQGRSLFSTNRSGRAYFFEPYTGYWFGCREENTVLLYNGTRNKYQVYDMVKDPLQRKNIADQKPQAVSLLTQRLATWIQFQNAYIKQLVETE